MLSSPSETLYRHKTTNEMTQTWECWPDESPRSTKATRRYQLGAALGESHLARADRRELPGIRRAVCRLARVCRIAQDGACEARDRDMNRYDPAGPIAPVADAEEAGGGRATY